MLRRTHPDVPRPFRTPLVPVVPLGGIAVCGAMMLGLPLGTWIRLVVWFVIGLVIYFTYARPPRQDAEIRARKANADTLTP